MAEEQDSIRFMIWGAEAWINATELLDTIRGRANTYAEKCNAADDNLSATAYRLAAKDLRMLADMIDTEIIAALPAVSQ